MAGRPGSRDGEGSGGEDRGGEGSSEGGKSGAEGSKSGGHFCLIERLGEWDQEVRKKDRGVGLNVRDVIGRTTQSPGFSRGAKQIIPRRAGDVALYKIGKQPIAVGHGAHLILFPRLMYASAEGGCPELCVR